MRVSRRLVSVKRCKISVPILTTTVNRRSTYRQGWSNTVCAQQLLQEVPPSYRVTQDGVSTPVQRLEVENITGLITNRPVVEVRGHRGEMYETHWMGLSRSPWERAIDLQLSRQKVLRYYWTGTWNQHRLTNRLLYRRMLIGGAQRGNFLGVLVSVFWCPAMYACGTRAD